MSATLGQLVVQLAADTARFQDDLGRAAQVAGRSAGQIKDSFSSAMTALTLEASAAATAVTAVFLSGISSAEDAGKLAQQVGVSVDSLTRLQFAAKSVGVPIEALDTGLKQLQRTAALAAGGNKQAEQDFSALGISVFDTSGKVKSADVLFADLAQKLSGYADGTTKTADAIIFMGRSGNELIPVINLSREGLDKFGKSSDAVGNTINEKAVKAADNFKVKLTELQGSIDGVKTSFATLTEPYIAKMIDAMTRLETQTGIATKTFNAMIDGFNIAGGAIHVVVDEFNNSVGMIENVIAAVKKGDLSGVLNAVVAGTKQTFTGLQYDFGVIGDGWDRAGNSLNEFVVKAKKMADAPIIPQGPQFDMGDQLSKAFETIDERTRATMTSTADAIDKVGPHFTNFEAGVVHTWDVIDQVGQEGAKGIQNDLEQFFFDPAKTGFSGLLTLFIDTIKKMVAQAAAAQLLKALFGTDKSGESGLGGIFSSFLGLAIGGAKAGGGALSGGTSYLVGESGPELFTPGGNGVLSPNGSMGGASVVVNNYLDARGATTDLVAALPGIMRKNNDALEARIVEGFRRGKYGK